MKRVLIVSLFLILVIFSSGQTFKKKYKGAIGPYPVTLILNSAEGTLTGTYYYESFDDPISIRGFISDKNIEFKGFDLKGNQISNNQKVILEQLNKNYTLPRAIDPKIESGDAQAIEKLSNALKVWISNQAKSEIELEDGTKKEVISNAGLDLINKLKTNPKITLEKLKIEGNVATKFNFDNFDLITWLIVS